MLDDSELEKCKSHYSKYLININSIDTKKLIISNNVSFGQKGFQYFIGYKVDEKVKPLCISLPRMSGSTKSYKETKYMFFSVKT